MIKDSNQHYGVITKIFHWLMAILIGWQLFKFGDRIAEGEHWVGETLVPWHVSIGALLLVLIVLRLLWVATQRHQRPELNPVTAKLAKLGHRLLYLGMLLMPLTGAMVLIGGGYGLNAFGLQIISEGEKIAWASSLGELHSPIAWILAVLIAGHIIMSLYHHFVRRDETLKRML